MRFLNYIRSNDIGAHHLTIPIPDPEKEANKGDIVAEPECTIPEEFEAGESGTLKNGIHQYQIRL